MWLRFGGGVVRREDDSCVRTGVIMLTLRCIASGIEVPGQWGWKVMSGP